MMQLSRSPVRDTAPRAARPVRAAERAARLPATDRLRARLAGWRDARLGLPLLPARVDAGGRVPAPETPFLRELDERARLAARQRLSRLVEDHADLIREVRVRSSEAGTTGRAEDVRTGRLDAVLARWATAVDSEMHHVEAIVHRHNQMVDAYWAEILARHPAFRAIATAQAGLVPGDKVQGVWLVAGVDDRAALPLDPQSWRPRRLQVQTWWSDRTQILPPVPELGDGKPPREGDEET